METKRRLTVGILLDSHLYNGMYPSWFYSPFIRGAQAAARRQGINLLTACGILRSSEDSRYRLAWPLLADNIDFAPVGPWNTDGLLIFSPLRTEQRTQFVRGLRERGFPLLFVGSGNGSPTIMPDNEGGMRQVLEHLVGHGHLSIAMIAGDPQDPGDSLARIAAYRRAVREFNLNDDPRLLEYGLHWNKEGYRAMQRILHSGATFTAVVCSNDFSSLGVVQALREAGLRIPWDVAVTGFDDQPEALVQIPPLTSVRYPLYETGYRALELIRRRIEEGPDALPPEVRMPVRLVRRQSCGCLPEIAASAAARDAGRLDEGMRDPPRFREILTQMMLEALEAETPAGASEENRSLCDRLAGAFLGSLPAEDDSAFRTTLIEILQQVEQTDGDAHSWQAVVSVLRLGLRAFRRGGPGRIPGERGEDLLHQARTLLSESTRRRNVRLSMEQSLRDEEMGRLTTRLLSAQEEDQIFQALKRSLPAMGIHSIRVMYFRKTAEDPVAASVVCNRGRKDPPVRFDSRRFPPPGLYPDGGPRILDILPLVFQAETLGYVAFETDDLRPLAMIALQLASAVKRVELHGRMLELSLIDGLTGVYNRRYFEILIGKEVERSHRYNRSLGVVMIDIDRFKDYNDRFGHPAGDEALRIVSRAIGAGARRGLDIVARYGGEEFAVILPETDAAGARSVAGKILRRVRSEPALHHKLTISLGIASLRGAALKGTELIRRADRALYQAKDRGRDCAVEFEGWMSAYAHPEVSAEEAADPPAGDGTAPRDRSGDG